MSQRFSQLSTENDCKEDFDAVDRKRQLSASSNPDVSPKRIKIIVGNDPTSDVEDKALDDVPAYLLATNELFLRVLQKFLTAASSVSVNDLQMVALLMHRIAAFSIQKQVTNAYLRSGTGKLNELDGDLSDIDRRVWPVQVTSALATKHATTTAEMDAESDQRAYKSLVLERSQEIKATMEEYQKQLDEKKRQLAGFTSEMEEAIIHYVQRYGIVPLQMKRDLKVALLRHDYDATILARKYAHEKPNDYQVRERVSRATCQK